MALQQFGCKVGEGINTDMRAVRKDYFLDHDHSAYVDQWDWERRDHRRAAQPRLPEGRSCGRSGRSSYGAEELACRRCSRKLKDPQYPNLPEELTFLHAEEILDMYPDLPRKQRETKILQKYPAVFIIGIGWVLKDGYPHEMRAADYDDWVTPTRRRDRQAHARPERRHPGLEPGDQAPPRADLDGHPRHQGDAEAAARDHRASCDFLKLPYHQAIMNDQIPLSHRRRHRPVAHDCMCSCSKAHLGEVSVTVWPKQLKDICAKKNIHVLE